MNRESDSRLDQGPKAVVHVDRDGATHIYDHYRWANHYVSDLIFESGMRDLLPFLEANGILATLFAIASDLDSPIKRELLEGAVAAGHEIASHSLTHAEFDRLDANAKRLELTESKDKIENDLCIEVRGFRAPSYQINRSTFETLADLGYQWDSSVFPARRFARRLEVLDILAEPHRPPLDCPLLELPLPGYRPPPFPFHPSYSLLLGQFYFCSGLRRHRKSGAPLVLLFHLIDVADPLPKDRLVGVRSRLYTLSNKSVGGKRRQCQKIIDRVSSTYTISTTDELVAEANAAQPRRLVLGISTTHETGAAIYDGHECLAAVSEERLDPGQVLDQVPPKLSIESAIETSGIDPGDVTDIVVAGTSAGPLFKSFVANQKDDFLDFHEFNDYFPHATKVLYRLFAWVRWKVADFMEERYGVRPRLHFAHYHQCHAASAYRTAPFDDALVVTADGVGDYVTVTVGTRVLGRIDRGSVGQARSRARIRAVLRNRSGGCCSAGQCHAPKNKDEA